MWKATVNEDIQFELHFDAGGTLTLNGKPLQADIREVDPGVYHLIHNHQSYTVELVKAANGHKALTLLVNGREYKVVLQDRYDLLLKKLGIADAAAAGVNEIKAPMPGMVLDVHVKAGQQVKKGTPLVVLEAMKMENVLKAPGGAKVKKVHAKSGDAVDKNALLIELA